MEATGGPGVFTTGDSNSDCQWEHKVTILPTQHLVEQNHLWTCSVQNLVVSITNPPRLGRSCKMIGCWLMGDFSDAL